MISGMYRIWYIFNSFACRSNGYLRMICTGYSLFNSSQSMQFLADSINEFSALIIYLSCKAPKTTYQLVDELSHADCCLVLQRLGFGPLRKVVYRNNQIF